MADDGNRVSDFVTKFMKRFHIGCLLFKCNAGKEKGVPVMDLKKQEHLDTIAMLKNSKAKFTYQGERLNVKETYSRNRKRRGRSRYLLSVSVDVEKDGESIPVKLVYVRNKGNRRDYLVLISTDTQLSEEGGRQPHKGIMGPKVLIFQCAQLRV